MDTSQVAAVRRFNRTVTERIGALDNDYLARARPLGASRVLWEVGNGATDARTLRASLDLDSGYMSRLLRSLETEGLVTVTPSEADGRLRTVAVTAEGEKEHAVLDRNSDAVAASVLAPLSPDQRADLVAAMSTVARLMTAGLVEVSVTDPGSEAARFCIGQYFSELDTRFESGFDPDRSISASAEELTEPAGLLLVARLRGEPVGCGGLKFHGSDPAEIKRMWVSRSVRGIGLGRRLLSELESLASERNIDTVRLETNQTLDEAIGLYRSAGYHEVPAFNDEPFAHHWFEKQLVGRGDW